MPNPLIPGLQTQPLPCPERQGPQPRAAVYQARVDEAGLSGWAPLATGLRNSLGLAGTRAADGTIRLWQAENSVDYSLMNTTRQALFLPVDRDSKYDCNPCQACVNCDKIRFDSAFFYCQLHSPACSRLSSFKET